MRELYAFMRAGAGTGGSSMTQMARRLLWRGGLRRHLDTAWARVAPRSKEAYHRRKWRERLPAWLAPDRVLRDDLLDRLLARRSPSLEADRRVPRSYYRHVVRSTSNAFMHHEFEVAFHVESHYGLRLLSPYHDRRLVGFFNRIPPRVLLHGARYKGLLRPIVARRLPGLGLENQRKDYPIDLQERRLQEMRAAMGAIWPTFGLDRLDRLGVLDAAAFRRAADDVSRLDFAGLSRLFALMSAERWVACHAAE